MDTIHPHRYLGLEELGDLPHLVVDGAPREHTTLVLSHWPSTPTPRELARDLSAEIVADYVTSPERWQRSTVVVTNDHLDIDGLVSLHFLVDPVFALAHRALLIEIARIGDFGVVRDAAAADAAWALETLMDEPELIGAHLGEAEMAQSNATTRAYRALLQVLPRIIERPELYRALGAPQRARFTQTVAEMADDLLTLREITGSDLAVIEVDESLSTQDGSDSSIESYIDLSAIASATKCSRLLLLSSSEVLYRDRYESWVRYVSPGVLLRRDLEELSRLLEERTGLPSAADPPGALTPSLRIAPQNLDRRASIGDGELVQLICDYLDYAPVAWDPWASGSPLRSASG
jgi:hypothetical protein